MEDLARGAVAGLAATLPMSLAMEALSRLLPPDQRRAHPPHEVTQALAARAGVAARDRPGRTLQTLAAHYGYGAVAGAAYAPLARRLPLPGTFSGPAFGLAVWAVGYLGWLPASGLQPPPRREPRRLGGMMIAAHLVWGLAAGLVVDALERRPG